MTKTIDELKSKSKVDLEKLSFELQDLKENSKQREDELENALKDREEELKSMKVKYDTELAIYN